MTDPQRPLFVEFAGVPGSGKSTLADALIRELRVAAVAVHVVNSAWRRPTRSSTAMQRLQLATAAVARRPSSAVVAARLVYRSRQRSISDARSVFVNWLCKERLMCGAAQSAVSVSDEGLLHALWSVSYRAAERAPLVQLGADALTALAAGVRWVVVRVSTEQQIASGWLLAREGAPNRLAIDIKTRGTAAIDDACAAADVVDRTIERLIANRACFQVVDVVNTPSISPAAAVRAVAESVRAEFVARVANPKEAVARRNDRAGE